MLAATCACAIATLIALWRRRFALARVAAAAQVALILLGWALAQYPMILVPDLTFDLTAAPPNVLRMLTLVFAIGAVLLLPSFYYLFRVFKGESASAPRLDG